MSFVLVSEIQDIIDIITRIKITTLLLFFKKQPSLLVSGNNLNNNKNNNYKKKTVTSPYTGYTVGNVIQTPK